MLEILVVLTLIALLSATVVPNLQQLVGSVERSTKREGVLADIAGLSYRAFILGQGFELSDTGMGQILKDGSPVLALPPGWRIALETPITYSFNGSCSGGRISILSPDAHAEKLVLEAPVCRINRASK